MLAGGSESAAAARLMPLRRARLLLQAARGIYPIPCSNWLSFHQASTLELPEHPHKPPPAISLAMLSPSSSVSILLFLSVTVLIFCLWGPEQHNAAKGNLQNTAALGRDVLSPTCYTASPPTLI